MKGCSRSSTTIFMYNWEKIICVTNRHLVDGDFLTQIDRVLAKKPKALILREKDLDEEAYRQLAEQVLQRCRETKVPCWFNKYWRVAMELEADGVQLSYGDVCSLTVEERKSLPIFGVSVHSPEEAIHAEKLGAAWVIFGHIFATDCKKGVPPRGLEALEKVCKSVQIPVFAIGGIHRENARYCLNVGANSLCMMSELMRI